jgi:hypothetical protein
MRKSFKLAVLQITAVTLTGCAGPAGAAANAASQTWTCPKEQVTVEQTKEPPPLEPPAEIAAVTERRELWQRTGRNSKDHPVFLATGCGRTLRLVCAYQLHYLTDGTPFMQWDCNRYGDPVGIPAAAPTVQVKGGSQLGREGGGRNVIDELDALAATMDAQGNTAAAAQIRSRAEQLRQEAVPSSRGSPSPPAPPLSREPAVDTQPLAH